MIQALRVRQNALQLGLVLPRQQLVRIVDQEAVLEIHTPPPRIDVVAGE